MRSSITHPIAERRRQERRAPWQRHRYVDGLARVAAEADPADTASYTCECGLVFSAAVSTTVRCPHCGAQQAW